MAAPKKSFPSVHRGLLSAAFLLISSDYFDAQMQTIMSDETILPDKKGDIQNGLGYHYYRKNGRNGIFRKKPSLETMFYDEIEACKKANHKEPFCRHLARAAHFVGDGFCPPHRLGWTYFSPYRAKHKDYEWKAARIFWGEDASAVDPKKSAQIWADLAIEKFQTIPKRDWSQKDCFKERLCSIEMSKKIATEEKISDYLCKSIIEIASLLQSALEFVHESDNNAGTQNAE